MDVFVQLPLHVKNWVCHYTRKNIDQDIVKLPLRHDHPFSSLIISLLERRDFPSARDHAFNLIISLPDENRWRGGYPDARYHHYEIPQDKSRYLTEFFESLMQKELFDRLL